jgi:hypothetical protein
MINFAASQLRDITESCWTPRLSHSRQGKHACTEVQRNDRLDCYKYNVMTGQLMEMPLSSAD